MATVLDRDDDSQSTLLALRVEWSSADIGDPEIVVLEPLDGGVGCDESRTPEVAAEVARHFAIKVGDRLFIRMTEGRNEACGRLRPCSSKVKEIWLMTEWWSIGK